MAEYVNAGMAGSVTQSGARIRTVKVTTEGMAEGMPVKLDADTRAAVVLETGDTMADFVGITIAKHGRFYPDHTPDYRGVLWDGFVQVPVADELEIKTGEAVYFDATNKVFTNATSGIAIPARFAVDGSADGVAEIHVFPALPQA